MIKKEYQKPDMIVIESDEEDVITSSPGSSMKEAGVDNWTGDNWIDRDNFFKGQ